MPKLLNEKNIKERFEDAISNLYKTNDYLAAEITKLGYPELIGNELPTAAALTATTEPQEFEEGVRSHRC